MRADIYTYNHRISNYLESLLGTEAEIDTSESDNNPLYSFSKVEVEKINFKDIDRFVNTKEYGEIRTSGGYEVRNSETGEFIQVRRSLMEKIASQYNNNPMDN
ncbi:MAG: hypothetical protein Q7S27_02225 [Nanoarchaeota archaeon]|nr:hypothetical protein [Nanoarchaeota archaeon]